MIRKILSALALASLCVCAYSQQTSLTPNIGLQIPGYGSSNWQVPLGYDLNRLDLFLSGNLPLPALTVTGGVNITGLTLTSSQITNGLGYVPLNPANNLLDVQSTSQALANLGGLGISAFQGAWSNSATYQLGQLVGYNGTAYVSLINSNIGNNPSSSPSDWQVFLTLGVSLAGDVNGDTGSNTVTGLHFGSTALPLSTTTPPSSSLPYLGWSGGQIVGLAGGGSGCGSGCIVPSPSTDQIITQPAGTQLYTNVINGTYLASQFQTPSNTGNNGISNAVSTACTGAGCLVIADPSYAFTEQLAPIIREAGAYNTGNYLTMPGYPGFTHVADHRGGFDSEIFNEPTGSGSSNPSQNLGQFPFGLYFNSAYDVTIPGNSTGVQTSINQSVFNGPGNQINGFGGVNLKSYDFGPVTTMVSSDQGQHIGQQYNLSVYGVGDAVGVDHFITCGGGASTYNDEGCHFGDNQLAEDNNVWTGTIASITNSTTLKATVTAGFGTQGDGRYVIDTAPSQVQSGSFPIRYITGTTHSVGQTPPIENFSGGTFATGWVGMVCDPAIDACTAGVDPTGKINSVSGGYAPGLITFDVLTSAPSMRVGYSTTTSGLPSTGIACVADTQYFETTTYSVISSSQIQLNLRKPHNDGMTVGIGGQCQTALEVTGGTFQYSGGGTKYRQVFPVVGNFSSTGLIVWDHDSQQGYSNAVLGNNGTAYCSTDSSPAVFSASGSTVTVFDSPTTNVDPHFAGQTAIVNTANSTYNSTGTTITLKTVSSGGLSPAYQYTLPSAPSGTPPTSGTIQFCNTGYNLYPSAEVLNVLNPSTNTVDGYMGIAPNSIAFNVGDTLEEPHYFWQANAISGGLTVVDQKIPRAPLNNSTQAGIKYGSLYTGGYPGWTIDNSADLNRYEYYGGTAAAPQTAYEIEGLWKAGIEYTQPPSIGGAMLQMDGCQPSPYGCSDALNSPIPIYRGSTAGHVFYDDTATGAFSFGTTAIQLNSPGFPMTMYTPSYGIMAFSKGYGSSFTPDATLEASAAALSTLTTSASITSDGPISSVSTTPATSSANANSPNIVFSGNYWNGTSSAIDSWKCYDNLSIWSGADTNPQSTLECDHSGSPAGGMFKVASLQATNANIANFAMYSGTLSLNSANIASSGTNYNSSVLNFQGGYWNGSIGTTDNISFQELMGTGTNPSATLQLTHAGTSGTLGVNFGPADVTIGNLTVSSCSGCGGGGGGASFPGTNGIVYNTSTTASANATSAQIAAALNTSPSTLLSSALIPSMQVYGSTPFEGFSTTNGGSNTGGITLSASDTFKFGNGTSGNASATLNASLFNAGTGFEIGGTATTGDCLVGSGGQYVDGSCGISGLTSGYIPLAGSSSSLTTNSHLDDGLTNPGNITSSESIIVAGGTSGISTPSVTYLGSTSGSAILQAQAVAGTPTITLPTVSGVLAETSAEVVTYSSTPTFSSVVGMSRIVLTGNITSFTLASAASGTLKTLCFKQGSGSYTVTPPTSVHGFFTIGTTSAKWNCQQFQYDASDSIWLAISNGVINQ